MALTLKSPVTEGLLTAFREAGVRFWREDGVPGSDDEAGAQAVIDAYGIDAYKAERRAEINALAAAKLDALTRGTAAAEMAVWAEKLAQARRIVVEPVDEAAAQAAGVRELWLEAQQREVQVTALAAKVRAKAAALLDAQAQCKGVAGKHKDAIDGQATIAAVLAYDITRGW